MTSPTVLLWSGRCHPPPTRPLGWARSLIARSRQGTAPIHGRQLSWAFTAAIAWWSLATLPVDRARRTFLLSGAVVTTLVWARPRSGAGVEPDRETVSVR